MKRHLSVLAVLVAAVVGTVASMAASGTAAAKPPPVTPTPGVYVTSTTTGDVVKIDPATLQVTQTIHTGAAWLTSIAVGGQYLYYSAYSSTSSSWTTIGRYNLSTQENQPTYINQQFYSPILRTSPQQPGVLFVGEEALSPADIQKWSVPARGKKPSLLARTEHGPMGSSLGDFQISEDGSKIWSACGAPYEFVELNTSDLRLSGRTFPAVPYPNTVDAVSADGTEYLLGGTDSPYDPSIHLYTTSDTGSGVHYGIAGTTSMIGSAVLSPDASKIYRVVTDVYGENGSIETLSAATGAVLTTTPVSISDYFAEGIHADPTTGRVFVSLDNAVGVLDPNGVLLQTIPSVTAARQVLIT